MVFNVIWLIYNQPSALSSPNQAYIEIKRLPLSVDRIPGSSRMALLFSTLLPSSSADFWTAVNEVETRLEHNNNKPQPDTDVIPSHPAISYEWVIPLVGIKRVANSWTFSSKFFLTLWCQKGKVIWFDATGLMTIKWSLHSPKLLNIALIFDIILHKVNLIHISMPNFIRFLFNEGFLSEYLYCSYFKFQY